MNLGRQGTSGGELSVRGRWAWARFSVNYSLYVPTVLQNVPNYQAGDRADLFLGALGHRGSFSGSVKPWRWISISPTVVVEGPKLSSGQNEADGTPTFRQLPTQVLVNLVARVEDVPVQGLSISLGVYNLLATDFRYSVPYASNSHGALPGLDREVLLKVGYLWEPQPKGAPRPDVQSAIAATGTGGLEITTPGLYGEIWVNNRPAGMPPAVVDELAPGMARIEVRVNGSVKRAMSVMVEAGQRTGVEVP